MTVISAGPDSARGGLSFSGLSMTTRNSYSPCASFEDAAGSIVHGTVRRPSASGFASDCTRVNVHSTGFSFRSETTTVSFTAGTIFPTTASTITGQPVATTPAATRFTETDIVGCVVGDGGSAARTAAT